MATYLICLTSGSGIPVFTRSVGNVKPQHVELSDVGFGTFRGVAQWLAMDVETRMYVTITGLEIGTVLTDDVIVTLRTSEALKTNRSILLGKSYDWTPLHIADPLTYRGRSRFGSVPSSLGFLCTCTLSICGQATGFDILAKASVTRPKSTVLHRAPCSLHAARHSFMPLDVHSSLRLTIRTLYNLSLLGSRLTPSFFPTVKVVWRGKGQSSRRTSDDIISQGFILYAL
ncbi:hypothetical protein EGW08_011182 [Elysia chlorotica]|uniref:Uncharacterized protein n=1 Tax=Elysia chlorotica TaxID=188477 RepID=A0A3S1BCX6_ELYCH|nr:hypothetical protein EGW08_011182 [Elysia chlorotica]